MITTVISSNDTSNDYFYHYHIETKIRMKTCLKQMDVDNNRVLICPNFAVKFCVNATTIYTIIVIIINIIIINNIVFLLLLFYYLYFILLFIFLR